MSLAAKQSPTKKPFQRPIRRLWRTPISHAFWLWLLVSLVIYGLLSFWYFQAARTLPFLAPYAQPLKLFGIIAFVLVLTTATYTLRRRFIRNLSGKVQSWLWMHNWLGILALLVAMLHENYQYILRNSNMLLANLTSANWGPAALCSLILMVATGILGRLIDFFQTRIIASEASRNGVGIERALDERILELEYTLERLCAGKSDTFKGYCQQALDHYNDARQLPQLPQHEHVDFQRAHEALKTRILLRKSRKRQARARATMRIWRLFHNVLATAALLIISYHAIVSLLRSGF